MHGVDGFAYNIFFYLDERQVDTTTKTARWVKNTC
jgi:hypothetical protein